jgi:hypothetical protein
VARAGAKALWSISQSKKNRDTMRKAGCVRLLARLLKSVHGDVVVPIMGTLQQCASEVIYLSMVRMSQDSSVSTVNNYGLNDWGSIPGRGKGFFF